MLIVLWAVLLLLSDYATILAECLHCEHIMAWKPMYTMDLMGCYILHVCFAFSLRGASWDAFATICIPPWVSLNPYVCIRCFGMLLATRGSSACTILFNLCHNSNIASMLDKCYKYPMQVGGSGRISNNVCYFYSSHYSHFIPLCPIWDTITLGAQVVQWVLMEWASVSEGVGASDWCPVFLVTHRAKDEHYCCSTPYRIRIFSMKLIIT